MSRPWLARVGLIGIGSLFLMLSGCGSDSDCKGSSCAAGVGGATVAATAGQSSIATGGVASSSSGGTGAGGATAAATGGTTNEVTSPSSGGASSSAAGGATLETTGGAPGSTGGSTAGATGGAATGGALPIATGGSISPAAGGTGPDSSGMSTGGTIAIATGGADATATGGASSSTGGSATNTTGGTAAAPTGGATSSNTGGSPSSGGTDANTGGTTDSSAGGASTGGQTGSDVILKYDFEDGTGTVVTDTSGNGMNGTLVDADWTANTDGRNGIAADFANADSAVALPNDVFAGASELTVTAWVFMTDNQQWNHLFDIGTGTDTDLYFTLNNASTPPGLELGLRLNGNAPQTLFTTTMLPLNVWKHVAITLSSKGAFMYVDGREVAREAGLVISPSSLGVTTSNWIGKSQFPYPEFSGRIDEFYMYKRALTKSEIAMLAWPKMDYSIWHFDETSGTVAHDSSDNARDGTLVNGTWAAGAFGGAVQLYNPSGVSAPSASDQYVQLPNGILKNCSQGYTVAAWIYLAAVFNHQRIFNFGNDAGNFIAARTKGGYTEQLALVNRTDATERYANINFTNPKTWTTGIWYHVATVRNGQTLIAYLNGSTTGAASATNTVTDPMPTADTLGDTPYNYVGKAMPTATDSRMHGLVDEFLVSCRPFTADEIAQLAYLPPS